MYFQALNTLFHLTYPTLFPYRFTFPILSSRFPGSSSYSFSGSLTLFPLQPRAPTPMTSLSQRCLSAIPDVDITGKSDSCRPSFSGLITAALSHCKIFGGSRGTITCHPTHEPPPLFPYPYFIVSKSFAPSSVFSFFSPSIHFFVHHKYPLVVSSH